MQLQVKFKKNCLCVLNKKNHPNVTSYYDVLHKAEGSKRTSFKARAAEH